MTALWVLLGVLGWALLTLPFALFVGRFLRQSNPPEPVRRIPTRWPDEHLLPPLDESRLAEPSPELPATGLPGSDSATDATGPSELTRRD